MAGELPVPLLMRKLDAIRLTEVCGVGSVVVHVQTARYSSMLLRATKCLRATCVPSSAPLFIRRSTVTRVTRRYAAASLMVTRPSGSGVSSKYHYPSHRLRFDVKRPLETDGDFVSRINKAAEASDEGLRPDTSDSNWLLGAKKRHRGSLHQDEWEGTAADLASRGTIAVYPATGWWRTRPRLEKYDVPARYSLIVSIRTEHKEVDLYNAIEQQIRTSVINTINL